MGMTINCPLCPYYEQTTSYGTELIKCNNTDCKRRIEMGMSIEEARTALGKERKYALHENKQAFDIAIATMRKYQQLQADYETRLKADLKAILVELQLEIEEVKTQSGFDEAWDGAVKQCSEIIQQKINSLKED